MDIDAEQHPFVSSCPRATFSNAFPQLPSRASIPYLYPRQHARYQPYSHHIRRRDNWHHDRTPLRPSPSPQVPRCALRCASSAFLPSSASETLASPLTNPAKKARLHPGIRLSVFYVQRSSTRANPLAVPQPALNLTLKTFNTPPPLESEDCLYLNIYAPSTPPPKGGRAVLFWIYGGGLFFGDASHAAYDGSHFAAFEDVILVASNYRLNGVLLSSPYLPGLANA